MHSQSPIPLYPHPPSSPNETQNALLSDGFPPIRVHETTPESSPGPLIHSGVSHSRSSALRKVQKAATATKRSLPGHSQSKNKGLGHNIVNTVEVTVQNKSSKRRLDAAYERPSKRQCRSSVAQDSDMGWIKAEIADIKMCLREIADHLRGDVDLKIEEIIDRLQKMRDMELGY